MTTIQIQDIVVDVETYGRFTNIARVHRVNDAGDVVAFVGKYIIGSRDADVDDLIERVTNEIY